MFPPAFYNRYYERTIANTESNNTSKESSDTQLFVARKFKVLGAIRRAPHLLAAKRQ